MDEEHLTRQRLDDQRQRQQAQQAQPQVPDAAEEAAGPGASAEGVGETPRHWLAKAKKRSKDRSRLAKDLDRSTDRSDLSPLSQERQRMEGRSARTAPRRPCPPPS